MKKGIFAARWLLSPLAIVLAIAMQLPAEVPATQTADEPIPAGAIRRFGDTRFSATSMEDFRSADFSPDGLHLVTAGEQARIWDVNSGSVVQLLDDQGQICDHAAYINADQIVVGWHTRKTIDLAVHDVHTGRRLRSISCDELTSLVDMAVSPDGSRLAVVGDHITLIDIQTGSAIASLGPVQAVGNNSVALPAPRVQFTTDSKTLLAVGTDMQAVFYNARTGVRRPTPPFATTHGATLTNHRLIAVLTDMNQIYDIASRQLLPMPQPLVRPAHSSDPDAHSRYSCMRMSPRGLFAVACCAPEARIFLWDTSVQPMQPPRVIYTRNVYPMSLVFSRDGQKLAVLSSGTRIEILDVASGNPICSPGTHMGDITGMDISPDGKALLTADCRGTLALWEMGTGKRLALRDGAGLYGIAATYGAVRFSPDGKSILIGGSAGTFETADAKTLKLLLRMGRPRAATRPADGASPVEGHTVCSPDCRTVAEWFPGMTAHLYDVQTRSQIQTIQVPLPRPTIMQFSPDSKTLAVPVDGGVNLYLVATGGLLPKRVPDMHITILAKARFSPDGQKLALFDLARLSMWDTAPGSAEQAGSSDFSIPVTGNGTGEFDDTGSLLIAADFLTRTDGKTRDMRHPGVTFYETETGRAVMRISNVQATVEAVRMVPHHAQLITAGADGTALLWDLLPMFADPRLATATEVQLWAQMSAIDPAPAYRAAAELERRNLLIKQARALKPDILKNRNRLIIQQWIDQLSSPDKTVKESAHKHLEAAGSAAAAAVAAALALHPGGETEDRLSDIARIIGTDGAGNAAAVDPELIRAKRLVRWLNWTDDPAAAVEAVRLNGLPASPASSAPAASQP